MLICTLVAAAAVVALGQAQPPPNGILVTVQFDNTLSRVQGNIKTVNKYMAEKLCRVNGRSVVAVRGKDQSSMLNHKSTVEFFCAAGSSAPGDVRKLVSNCNGMWNRHQLKDEIEDHTTPDIEVQKVISCTPIYMAMGGRK